VWNYSRRGEKKLAVGERVGFKYLDAGPPRAVSEAKKRIGTSERKYAKDEVEKGDAAWEQAERAGSYDAAQPLWESARGWYMKAVAATLGRKQMVQQPKTGETRMFEGIEMVWCPPGTFTMGSDDGERNEKPVHRVTLTEGFWLGKYEVTQSQWERVMGSNPSRFKGSKNPVEHVSREEAQSFCKKLGSGFRLPTEAEWEYACRAGSTAAYCFGDSESGLGSYAWCSDNSGGMTHAVGEKKPNVWGINDMHGNVYEWCQDWYADYPSGSVADPRGASFGSGRVFRGGSWFNSPTLCRSAYRYGCTPSVRFDYLGFRLCRSAR